MKDERQSIGLDTDALMKTESGTFKIHKHIISRLPSFASLFENNQTNEISVNSFGGLSKSDYERIISFVYSGFAHDWDSGDWNALFMGSLGLEMDDLNEALIKWREAGSDPSRTERGEVVNKENKVVVGWKKGLALPLDDLSDALTYAFEFEGNGMQILNYYRPESVSEEQWKGMGMSQKNNVVKQNWCSLKRLIDDENAFHWMNKDLTIEDAGFLWEISYGGNTPGFAVDLDHCLEEMNKATDMALGVGDREMDSGIQGHLVFPFFEPEDEQWRKHVMALAIHLDDFVYFDLFSRSILDDCNNLWTNEDIQLLFESLNQGYDDFDAFISQGLEGLLMPNVRVKHKHVGIRGRDTYKIPNRFGFELRRCGTTEQLGELFTYTSSLFSQMGDNGNSPDDVSVRLRTGFSKTAHNNGYPLSSIYEFISNPNIRVSPSNMDEVMDIVSEDYLDKLDQVAERWVKKMIKWEYHLVLAKILIWDGKFLDPTNQNIVEHSWLKIRRRLIFILWTDWSLFPLRLVGEKESELMCSIKSEQLIIRNLLSSLKGKSTYDQMDKSTPEYFLERARLTQYRGLITDYAQRLARLY